MKAKGIVIYNVTKKAEELIEELYRITKGNFHNFKFAACPIGGSLDIYLSSDYDFEDGEKGTPEYQLLSAFNFALMSEMFLG